MEQVLRGAHEPWGAWGALGGTCAQEVTVHVIAPAAELAKAPVPGAVALFSLKEAAAAGKALALPQVRRATQLQCSGRGGEAGR